MAVDDEMEETLEAHSDAIPEQGYGSNRATFETILTDGYARALELEAERARLARELALRGDARTVPPVLAALNERVRSLRNRLDEANRRLRSSGQHQLDGRAVARRGFDDELGT